MADWQSLNTNYTYNDYTKSERQPPNTTINIIRRVPVQRAVERDEIPNPYKVHDTTLRPLLNITIKSTIVVRNRSKSCGGGDICGTTSA